MVQTYWQIGHHIVEYEQGGSAKAEYGAELLNTLSRDLTMTFGKGFSRSNLIMFRKFYLTFPKIQTVSGQFEMNHSLSVKMS